MGKEEGQDIFGFFPLSSIDVWLFVNSLRPPPPHATWWEVNVCFDYIHIYVRATPHGRTWFGLQVSRINTLSVFVCVCVCVCVCVGCQRKRVYWNHMAVMCVQKCYCQSWVTPNFAIHNNDRSIWQQYWFFFTKRNLKLLLHFWKWSWKMNHIFDIHAWWNLHYFNIRKQWFVTLFHLALPLVTQ